MRMTKDILENQIDNLRYLLKLNQIDKSYEVGYRYGYTYLDEQSHTNQGCIIRSIAVGTKKEVSEVICAICDVLR